MTGETWDGFPRLVGSFFGYVSVQLEGSFKPLTGILSWWQTNRTQQPSQLPHLATIVGRIPTGIACPRPRDGQVEVYNTLCIYNIHNIYILHNIHTYVYIYIYLYIYIYYTVYIYLYIYIYIYIDPAEWFSHLPCDLRTSIFLWGFPSHVALEALWRQRLRPARLRPLLRFWSQDAARRVRRRTQPLRAACFERER